MQAGESIASRLCAHSSCFSPRRPQYCSRGQRCRMKNCLPVLGKALGEKKCACPFFFILRCNSLSRGHPHFPQYSKLRRWWSCGNILQSRKKISVMHLAIRVTLRFQEGGLLESHLNVPYHKKHIFSALYIYKLVLSLPTPRMRKTSDSCMVSAAHPLVTRHSYRLFRFCSFVT